MDKDLYLTKQANIRCFARIPPYVPVKTAVVKALYVECSLHS